MAHPPLDPLAEHIRADEERVKAEYARRADDPRLRRYYARVGGAARQAAEDRLAVMVRTLDALGPRARLKILDVGCGRGGDLARLVDAGFHPARLAGIDPLESDVAIAKLAVPGADVRVGNGAGLPYQDGLFDATLQTTVLSSVVDPAVRAQIASEMLRVTRPGGMILSYDLRYVTDGNPNLVSIEPAELRRLFGGGGTLSVMSMTLALPIASRMPVRVARLLAAVPQLRSHNLAVTRKPDVAP
jgi:SAM-dependent methyltransferase